ncbi:hypothetical protein B0W81_03365 [Prochlorococcus sp. HOT_208_60]|nr:hypothetical protein B0W81_03365 [Prochlorococcus sp. HOT_208_60]
MLVVLLLVKINYLMDLNKALKISLGVLLAFPLSFFVGNELLANNFTERFDNTHFNDSLLACGGGGGGKSPAQKAAAKAKKAKAKLSFKKRALSKAAAAGEDTSSLEAEIAELEALIAK